MRLAPGHLRDTLELRRDRRVPQPEGVAPEPIDDARGKLIDLLGGPAEEGPDSIEAELRERLDSDADHPVFPHDFNASLALARMCWLACRLTQAQLVVETGVAAGLTTSFILDALEHTGGRLHSIDLPPPDSDPENVGWLVPDRLRERWTLHRGRSRKLLPGVLRERRPQVFVHDGLHTQPTMSWELHQASVRLDRPGVVLCDDAERHPAFANWAIAARPTSWSLVETEFRGHHFGLAAFAG